MRVIFQAIILLLLLSSEAFAARDPVAWSVDRNLPNPMTPGRSATITYTITSQLPATMTKPVAITKNASPSSDFTYTDNCTGLLMTPSQSCTVAVTLTPHSLGNKTLQLAISGYDNNVVLIPTQYTVASGDVTSSVYGKPTQFLPSSSTAGSPQTYGFEFVNAGSTALSNVSIVVTQTDGTPSYQTSNCGSTLSANNGTCLITGQYTPENTPSVQTVTATMNYNSGSSVSAFSSTNVSSKTGVVASFAGTQYLPAVMSPTTPTPPVVINVLYTNYGPTPVTLTSDATLAITVGGASATLTGITNNCHNLSSLPVTSPASACNIQGNFALNGTPGGATPITVEASLSYSGATGSPLTIDTSTTAYPALALSRTLTFTNNCNFPVWFSLNGGAPTTQLSCAADADCNPGIGSSANYAQACDTTNSLCYWKNFAPAGGGSVTAPAAGVYKLDATGTPGGVFTNTVTILSNSLDPSVLWSGNISASLLCNGTSCGISDCNRSGGTAACSPGQGFGQPATQAEFTFQKGTTDSYDVEIINGFTLPISMSPDAPVNISGYTCGTPGNPSASNGFGACNWSSAVVPAQKQYPATGTLAGNGYYTISTSGLPSPSACNIATGLTTGGASCPATTVCGLDKSFNQYCGKFIGYWTADEVCGSTGIPAAVSTYFMCGVSLNSLNGNLGFPANSNLSDLMLCSVPSGDSNTLYNSCYLNYTGLPSNNQFNCCGCMDWWTLGIGSNNTANSCTKAGQASPQTDPVWNQYVQYGVQWLKTACPSSYTYPFDDATSGFSCTNTLPGSPNSTNYTFTFCAGNSGLPSGITEGRG